MTRSILITGSASGIGWETTKLLAAQGWRVFATCRRAEDLARLEEIGAEALLLDYAAPDSIAAAADAVLERTDGRLGALLNNGAFATPGALEDLPTDALREIFEVNVFGWHELTRRVLPALRREDPAHLIFISSILGRIALRFRGAYNMSKFATEAYADTLRRELRDTSVRVVLIEPGPVDTRFRAGALASFRRWIDPAASRHAAAYAAVQGALDGGQQKNRFAIPPEAVAHTIYGALNHAAPPARYVLTTPARMGVALNWALPTRLVDAVFTRRDY